MQGGTSSQYGNTCMVPPNKNIKEAETKRPIPNTAITYVIFLMYSSALGLFLLRKRPTHTPTHIKTHTDKGEDIFEINTERLRALLQ